MAPSPSFCCNLDWNRKYFHIFIVSLKAYYWRSHVLQNYFNFQRAFLITKIGGKFIIQFVTESYVSKNFFNMRQKSKKWKEIGYWIFCKANIAILAQFALHIAQSSMPHFVYVIFSIVQHTAFKKSFSDPSSLWSNLQLCGWTILLLRRGRSYYAFGLKCANYQQKISQDTNSNCGISQTSGRVKCAFLKIDGKLSCRHCTKIFYQKWAAIGYTFLEINVQIQNGPPGP